MARAKKVAAPRANKKTLASLYVTYWDNCEELTLRQYKVKLMNWLSHHSADYTGKDLKPSVLRWMATEEAGFTAEQIKLFKSQTDSTSRVTWGSVAKMLLQGAPASHPEYNDGASCAVYLQTAITEFLSKVEVAAAAEPADPDAPVKKVVNIQTRLLEQARERSGVLEAELDELMANPKYDIKGFEPAKMLADEGVTAAHARHVRKIYEAELKDFQALKDNKADADLKESYSHIKKLHMRRIVDFYTKILEACDKITTIAKANKAPRKRKPVPPSKIIAKVKYKKTDDTLKVKSVSPVDIIGAKEVWVYNCKTRKLGHYVADALLNELSVKGTSIVGFDATRSIQKTLRKPQDQIKDFMKTSKVATRKYMDKVKAIDIRLNGRMNAETLILKVVK